MKPTALKTSGYIISTLSVILLAVVSWKATAEDPVLRACLVGGALASVLGMFCRWLSYEFEKKRRRPATGGGPAAHGLSGALRRKEMSEE